MADISQTAGSVLAAANSAVSYGTSGASIAAGAPIYKNSSNVFVLSKSDALATALCDGIALNGASTGQPVTYLPSGSTIDLGATLTVGQTYVVSAANAGKIAPVSDYSSGAYPVVLGVAFAAGTFKLNITVAGVVKP